MTSYAAVQSEPLVRLAVFLVVFTAVALWEVFAPRRTRSVARGVRWPHNLGLLLIDAAVLRILAPGAAIAVALAGEERGWGLLHGLPLPAWVAVPLAVGLLDLAIYFQHVTFHAVRSEEHTSELQSRRDLVCRLLLEK